MATNLPSIRLSELIAALSHALDLTEGRPMGHSVRSCMLGMRIAQEIGMPVDQQADLYYALLLKDAGCSSNSSRLFHILNADEIRAKRDVKTTDWTRVGWDSLQYAIGHVAVGQPMWKRVWTLLQVAANQQRDSRDLVKIRCERGGQIARRMGFSEPVAEGIFSLDEHWDGGGYPDHLRGKRIPLFSRILNLAQTLDVFFEKHGTEAAMDVARQRSGRWFDPDLLRAAASVHHSGRLFMGLASARAVEDVIALEPEDRRIAADEARIDSICLAFADVIDAKSPFTYRHSNGVADAAVAMARYFGFDAARVTLVRRAALLHDIGKLGVSNTILEKPASLTDGEFEVVRQHPFHTQQILQRISIFGQLSEIAASHHEKLDGSGYFRGLTAEQLSLPARMLVVADIYDALSADRPYREALPLERVFGVLKSEAPHKLDMGCVHALFRSRDAPRPDQAGLLELTRALGTPVAPEPVLSKTHPSDTHDYVRFEK